MERENDASNGNCSCEDSKEMFIRRHIEIPSGSRRREAHTVNKHLLPEAFLSLVPHKMECRRFSAQHLSVVPNAGSTIGNTLIFYQLKRARSYAEEHSGSIELTDDSTNFPIEGCTQHGVEDIIRLQFLLAHKSCTYHTYVQYDTTQIIAWYCTCTARLRTVGCWSHVAVAIWYLSYEHHQIITNRESSSTNTNTIQYTDNISNFEPSSDDEDNDYLDTLNWYIYIYTYYYVNCLFRNKSMNIYVTFEQNFSITNFYQ